MQIWSILSKVERPCQANRIRDPDSTCVICVSEYIGTALATVVLERFQWCRGLRKGQDQEGCSNVFDESIWVPGERASPCGELIFTLV